MAGITAAVSFFNPFFEFFFFERAASKLNLSKP